MSRQQFITKYNWFLVIKNMFKKKSIFYDPMSILSSSDIALQGVRLISGPEQLKLYLKNL